MKWLKFKCIDDLVEPKGYKKREDLTKGKVYFGFITETSNNYTGFKIFTDDNKWTTFESGDTEDLPNRFAPIE